MTGFQAPDAASFDERLDRAKGLVGLNDFKESIKAISDLLCEQPDNVDLERLPVRRFRKSIRALR